MRRCPSDRFLVLGNAGEHLVILSGVRFCPVAYDPETGLVPGVKLSPGGIVSADFVCMTG